MKKLFDVEITRYYSKTIVIMVEADDEQDAKDQVETNKDLHDEVEKRISEVSLSWDDDSTEVYPLEQEEAV